jgi:hypothetical protein
MSMKIGTTEARLRGLARGHFGALGSLSGLDDSTSEASNLDPETLRLVQFAALAAVDAPAISWLRHLEAADEIELGLEKILGTLLAVTPIVGTSKVVSAGAKIVRVAALGEEFGSIDEG